VNASGTDKLLGSLPKNDAAAELCSIQFNMAYSHDPE
jgi:hypothetical protein